MWESIAKIWAKYSGVYWEGLVGTLWIASLTVLLGTLVGTLLAVLRLSRSRAGQVLYLDYTGHPHPAAALFFLSAAAGGAAHQD